MCPQFPLNENCPANLDAPGQEVTWSSNGVLALASWWHLDRSLDTSALHFLICKVGPISQDCCEVTEGVGQRMCECAHHHKLLLNVLLLIIEAQ